MKTAILRKLALGMACVPLLFTAGCGGGGDNSSNSTSPTSAYISFQGSANGDAVRDANNEVVRFLKSTRKMEVFTQVPTDISLDSASNLVQGGTKIIGAVQLVGAANNAIIAGLVANNGTMLAVDNSMGSSASLKATNTTFAKPGTVSTGGSGSTSTGNPGGTSGTGSTASCTIGNYKGPTDDPQTDSFCKNAYINQCLDTATGTSNYKAQTASICRVLDGLLKATSSNTAANYCSYCR